MEFFAKKYPNVLERELNPRHWTKSNIGGFHMSKFSKEFKFRVVQEYLNSSVGIGQLARKYGIKSDASILKWVNQYQVFGDEGLEVRRPTFIYDGSFKVNVLKW